MREAGAVIVQQLYHVGAHGNSDLFFCTTLVPFRGPSYRDSDGFHKMSEAEIEELLQAHIVAAIRAKKAELQGVEVWLPIIDCGISSGRRGRTRAMINGVAALKIGQDFPEH